jgi:threonine synthase
LADSPAADRRGGGDLPVRFAVVLWYRILGRQSGFVRDLKVNYISTRGRAPQSSFTEALLGGLAPDGGLYVPSYYPAISADAIASFAGNRYAEVAQHLIAPFLGDDRSNIDLRPMLEAAYASFRHSAVTPLVQIDPNLFVLELFHGPTLAFKDVAMQLLAPMMDHVLKRSGRRATIVGATSGDTGAAAIEAFRGLSQVDVFILYPHGRVSDVQRRQMTTLSDANVHTLAIEGTFDDAQAILKGLFNDPRLRSDLNLAGVNSINWARILAQIVYYFVAGVALGAPHRRVSFCVPTGNFGDIFAGYVAKRMGLPIHRLVIATNANDILARTLSDGHYELRDVMATQSPSMDIQISSNFERLIFDAYGRDPQPVDTAMARLKQARRFALAPTALAAVRADFSADSASESDTLEEIKRTFAEAGYVLDPHSAIGVAVARRFLAKDRAAPMIVLGTAHPSKFPAAVAAAIGSAPALPRHLRGLMHRPERLNVLPNEPSAVEGFLRRHCRVAHEDISA